MSKKTFFFRGPAGVQDEFKNGSEATQVAAVIISLQFVPLRRSLPLLLVPAEKFSQRLPIVPLSIDRRAALRGEVEEELVGPFTLTLHKMLVKFFRS